MSESALEQNILPSEEEILAFIFGQMFEWRGIQKLARYQNLDFIEFVKTLPCIVPKCLNKDISPSHLLGIGRARNNAHDFLVLPMCIEPHHKEYEPDPIRFAKVYGVNLGKSVIKTLELYFDYKELSKHSRVEVTEKIHRTVSKRVNRQPMSKTCNTPTDFSQYQPQ